MIRFILNEKLIETELPSGSTVLDFVRYHKRLTGTKIGCREGDCGACTILVGDIENDKLAYRSMTSCLMPLGNANGKHIVSVEGINLPAGRQGMKELSPVQQTMVDTNGTQCGFCTIGFVMSLTGFVLNETAKQYEEAIAAIDGNICRCTGYKSIERAAKILSGKMNDKPGDDTIGWLAANNFIPQYFTGIHERLQHLKGTIIPSSETGPDKTVMIGGGTDLVVQKALAVKRSSVQHLFGRGDLNDIRVENGKCYIGGAVTVTAFAESVLIQDLFPNLQKYIRLVSSTPIRNMATMAGNLVNASPIGDMSVFFLALNSDIVLNNAGEKRTIKLKDLYKGYKQLDKVPGEIIEQIVFTVPQNNQFNFEKVCKRTHLDIASVNSACQLKISNDVIGEIHLSAGGVAPFPKYLSETAAFLKGKMITAARLKEAIAIMNKEIAPISDARGTAEYKRLLLRQLFLSHFESRTAIVKQVVGI